MKKILFSIILLSAFQTYAQDTAKTKQIIKLFAQSENLTGCELLLRDGVFNFFSTNYSHYTSSQWHNAWCSGTVKQTSSSGKTGVSLDIVIEEIPLGMSYDDAKSFKEYYKQTFCSSQQGTHTEFGNSTLIQKFVDPNILAAYVKCKETEGKGVTTSFTVSDDLQFVTIDLKYQKVFETRTPPKIKTVSIMPADAVLSQKGNLTEGASLDANTKGLAVQRNTGKPLSITIITDLGTFTRNLPPVIPPPSNQELVLGAFPKGSIIIWGIKSGAIPKGWIICDGTNGTPNLVDHFAYGTNNFNNVQTTAGSKTITLKGTTGAWVKGSSAYNGANGNNSSQMTPGKDGKWDVELSGENMPPYTNVVYIMKL